MDPSHGGQVHIQPFSYFAKPVRARTRILQPLPDGLGAVLQAFSARLRDPSRIK
jgi:hypothetical protein